MIHRLMSQDKNSNPNLSPWPFSAADSAAPDDTSGYDSRSRSNVTLAKAGPPDSQVNNAPFCHGIPPKGCRTKGCRTKGCRTRRLPKQGCRSKYIFLIGFNMNICGTVGASFAPFPPSSRSTVAPPDTQILSMHNNHRISQQPVALGLSAQQSAQQSAVSTAATTVNCYSSCQR